MSLLMRRRGCAQEKSVSLWAIIRECVGKDLTRICLPVYFNEPLSALQKLAEDLEYSVLLDQARLSQMAECKHLSPNKLVGKSVWRATL